MDALCFYPNELCHSRISSQQFVGKRVRKNRSIFLISFAQKNESVPAKSKGNSSNLGRRRGFGLSKGKEDIVPETKDGEGKAEAHVESILQRLDEETGNTKQLDINPKEAAKGRVDFVQVANWGSGAPEEVENLQLKSFSPSYSAEKETSSFYENLARRLQLLESKGEIAVANAKPLPPFERWTFGSVRYLRYLKNQLAVHCALEAGIQRVVEGQEIGSDRALESLRLFGRQLGLFRSEAFQQDIEALTAEMDQNLLEGKKVSVDAQSLAYAKYITQISIKAQDLSDPVACRDSRLRLLAHVYALQVSHLSSGMRIGAKAVSLLPQLRKSMAVRVYRDYPKNVEDPLKVFVAAFNQVGEILDEEQMREEVMSELPKAIQKTSLLLSELAVEDKVDVSNG